MTTMYGKEVKEGDYCLVLDHNYVGRSALILPARCFRGKAVTGKMMSNGKYINKISAICQISESDLSPEEKDRIEQYIIYLKGKV